MNIFNMKDYLKDIIKSLNNINTTITNMDKKVNYYINNNTPTFNEHTKKEKEEEPSSNIQNDSKQDSNYEEKINKLTELADFHKSRSEKTWKDLKHLRNVVDSVSSEKRELELKVKSLEKDLEKLQTENQILTDENKALHIYKNRIENNELKELKLLTKIKKIICSSDKGKSFWDSISSKVEDNGDLDKKSADTEKKPTVNTSYDFTIAGITKTRSQWRDEWNLSEYKLRYRINHNWDNLEILFGKDFKYTDAKKFYKKYPNAILYDNLDNAIKDKLKNELNI